MIVLPWPHKSLTPNAKRRKHWRSYQPHANADRLIGKTKTTLALSLAQKRAIAAQEVIPMVVRFYPPDKRRRDDDGAISAFKHLRDGIADALGCDDHKFKPTYQFMDPEKPGRVEVDICSNDT